MASSRTARMSRDSVSAELSFFVVSGMTARTDPPWLLFEKRLEKTDDPDIDLFQWCPQLLSSAEFPPLSIRGRTDRRRRVFSRQERLPENTRRTGDMSPGIFSLSGFRRRRYCQYPNTRSCNIHGFRQKPGLLYFPRLYDIINAGGTVCDGELFKCFPFYGISGTENDGLSVGSK